MKKFINVHALKNGLLVCVVENVDGYHVRRKVGCALKNVLLGVCIEGWFGGFDVEIEVGVLALGEHFLKGAYVPIHASIVCLSGSIVRQPRHGLFGGVVDISRPEFANGAVHSVRGSRARVNVHGYVGGLNVHASGKATVYVLCFCERVARLDEELLDGLHDGYTI